MEYAFRRGNIVRPMRLGRGLWFSPLLLIAPLSRLAIGTSQNIIRDSASDKIASKA